MSWLVIACGVLLAAGGGYSIVSGAPYTQMEFGWTEVIAGTTALAGGLVTIALGAILYRLGALQKVVARAVMPAAAAAQTADSQTADAEASVAVAPPPFVPVPDRSEAEMPRVAPRLPDLDPRSSSTTDVPPPRSLLSGLRGRFRSARTTPDVAPVSLAEPHLTMRPSLLAVSSSPDATPDAAPPVASPAEMETEARLDPASAENHVRRVGVEDTDGRDVVGRYEAGGASYMLFSDGTIEVETATGTHRFASMEELKAFVERQDAEKASLDL